MQRTNTIICCHDWPIDCGLLTKTSEVRNIPCSIGISIGLPSTTNTMEPTRLTIMSIDEATLVAPLAGVTWVDHQNGFACSFGFLRDELPQLIERPAMQPPIEVAAFTLLVPYAFEVFERESVEVCGNYLLADTMVAVEVVPSLSQSQTTKMPLAAVSACLLQPTTKEHYLSTDTLVFRCREQHAVAQCADITLSHVDTEKIGRSLDNRCVSLGDKVKREVLVRHAKCARLDGPTDVLLEVFWDTDAVTFPSIYSAKTDTTTFKIWFEGVMIKPDTATKFFGCDSSELVAFERLNSQVSCGLDERRIQLRPTSTSGFVAFLVQQVFVAGMQSQSFTDMEVTTTIEGLDSIKKFLMFRQTKLDGALHHTSTDGDIFKLYGGTPQFTTELKTRCPLAA